MQRNAIMDIKRCIDLKARTMSNIAIIPARGQSKRLIKKNLKVFDGRPLIQWTVEAARNSKLFDEIHISTDCPQIKKISEDLGYSVLFDRPYNLATDHSDINDTITFVLNEFKKRDRLFKSFCLLQPTSPLRNANHIIEAYELYKKRAALSVISVNRTLKPLNWVNILGPNNEMDQFIRELGNSKRSQDYSVYFELNGAIFIRCITDYLKNKTLYPIKGAVGYELPWHFSIDIDTQEDFMLAEVIKKYLLNDPEK